MSSDDKKASSPPRHWHGQFGDRYEHHNVWVRGGPAQPYMRRPSTSVTEALATSDRRTSSASDTSDNSSANRSPPPIAPDRRKSSGHGPSTLFENLTNQKRNAADSTLTERRQSWNEQAQQGGFFARWWDGYTRGNK